LKKMPGESSEQLLETLAGIEKELCRLREALTLVGLRRCSQCGKFFLSSEPGALFEGGEPVCLACVEGWWVERRQKLCVKERDVIERRLVNWLANHHNAKLVLQPAPAEAGALQIIAGCVQCDGAGMVAGRRCSSCEGRGTVWLVVPNRGSGKGG
jgi:hypothetical protein